MPQYVKAFEASKFYKVAISTLRKWAREGTIKTTKTPGDHYLYFIPDSETLPETKGSKWNPNILYSRVSSKKQSKDLSRQSKFLQEKYPDFALIEDIGSGINFKRHGFQKILEHLFTGSVKKVVVAHSDRFVRFGFDFFQWLFSKFNATLEVLESHDSDPGSDLVEDVMEIFTVFTARYYGSRKYSKTSVKKSKTLPKYRTKKVVQKVSTSS